MFAIALQRDTIETEGNEGVLFIGGLSPGVHNENLMWVPVRKYTLQQDGLTQDAFPELAQQVIPHLSDARSANA
ncbi:hypothetical protein C8R48DRAFT_767204 [Suillus tomentosus]|nr:hypothetical protein C8R48DRAFT_767204 [Suillus tomentosus]